MGRYSRNYANAAVRDADVILAIGTRLGGLVTDSYRLINPQAHLIHVTVDPEVIGQNFPTQTGLVADAGAFLSAMLAVCDRMDASPPDQSSAYLMNLAQARGAWRERRAESGPPRRNGRQPYAP